MSKPKQFTLPYLPPLEEELSVVVAQIRDGENEIKKINIASACMEQKDVSKIYFLQTRWENGKFKQCDFSKTTFVDCILSNCNFMNCNFSGTYFRNCLFENCKFVGCDFISCFIKETVFRESIIQYANLNESGFESVFLDSSRLVSSEVSECKIKKLTVENTILNETNFFKTPLKDVDFTNSEIGGITLSSDFFELRGATLNVYQAADLIKRFGIKVKI